MKRVVTNLKKILNRRNLELMIRDDKMEAFEKQIAVLESTLLYKCDRIDCLEQELKDLKEVVDSILKGAE